MTAVLWTIAAGFFIVPHYQAFRYPSVAACEADRPHMEEKMRFHGYTGIRTRCIEVKDGDL